MFQVKLKDAFSSILSESMRLQQMINSFWGFLCPFSRGTN